jgi:SAM-dependent methyltransferase
MDTDVWKKLWDGSHSGSFFEKCRGDEKEWKEFWDGKSGGFLENIKRDEPFYRGIIKCLENEGYFRRGDIVMDIACGPGTYSLLFAESAKSVSALDISSGMLSMLAEEAKRRDLSNIDTVLTPWSDYDGTTKYDLVFTALSPAINGPDMLLKMENISKRSCCYMAFGDDRFTGLRNEIWELITGRSRKGDRFNISIPFGLLLSMGRRPNVKFFDKTTREERQSVDDIVSMQVDFLKTFIEIDDEKKSLIREYVRSKADNGILRFGHSRSLVALYWNVPD